jgi:hypothetical protein
VSAATILDGDITALEHSMADLSIPSEPTMPNVQTSRPLLSSLTRWWSPAETSSSVDPELGYESALPWTLHDALEARASD